MADLHTSRPKEQDFLASHCYNNLSSGTRLGPAKTNWETPLVSSSSKVLFREQRTAKEGQMTRNTEVLFVKHFFISK